MMRAARQAGPTAGDYNTAPIFSSVFILDLSQFSRGATVERAPRGPLRVGAAMGLRLPGGREKNKSWV